MGLFDKLKGALAKTKTLLRTDVRDLFSSGEMLDETKLREFEKKLIESDMGVKAADSIVSELRSKHGGRKIEVD
jgi:fused signal recognition particle receptor